MVFVVLTRPIKKPTKSCFEATFLHSHGKKELKKRPSASCKADTPRLEEEVTRAIGDLKMLSDFTLRALTVFFPELIKEGRASLQSHH